MNLKPTLYIVATPIGNLQDLTLRAQQVLADVDLIVAEDTRHSSKLLKLNNITTKLAIYNDHSNEKDLKNYLNLLESGKNLALISDAGTPLISDPGYRLVNAAIEHDISVVPVPGACALIAALSVSGLPTDNFYFAGFLKAKSAGKLEQLAELANISATLIFYEAPHRLLDSLQLMQEVIGGNRKIVVARELTKIYEEIKRGTIEEVIEYYRTHKVQGEIVILVAPKAKVVKNELTADAKLVLDVLLSELSVKQASKLAAKITGISKKTLYDFANNNKQGE